MNKPNFQPGGILHNQPYTSVTEESRKACKIFRYMKRLPLDEDHGYIFVFGYYPVRPVIQSGPICGMVALAMASGLIKDCNVTVEEILSEARKRGFSKQGEVFSASALQELAAHFLPCKVTCFHLQHDDTTHCLDGKEIVEQLVQRNLILIPYDSDRNFAPCQKQGHKAHWALLTGFFIAVKAVDVPEGLLSHCRREADIPMLYHWPDDPQPLLCDQLTKLVRDNAEDLFVLGHHGKSKFAGLWSLHDLLLSNDNLLESSVERKSEDYVLPSRGLKNELRSQIVSIHIKNER